jgi:2-polyprenyl-6-methoxyphenol hydroxylase-like FAD-dependent oxidoreductase
LYAILFETILRRIVRFWNIWIDGEEVFVSPRACREAWGACHACRLPTLLERVVEEAGRYPTFTFERGARFRGLIREENGRLVGTELQTDTGLREVRADLVIGCDGRGSLVRKRAGLKLNLLPENYDVL